MNTRQKREKDRLKLVLPNTTNYDVMTEELFYKTKGYQSCIDILSKLYPSNINTVIKEFKYTLDHDIGKTFNFYQNKIGDIVIADPNVEQCVFEFDDKNNFVFKPYNMLTYSDRDKSKIGITIAYNSFEIHLNEDKTLGPMM